MKAAWWWIDRWRKSTAYTDMTLAEQGAYRNLLDELWLRGGVLPLDERTLGRASGDAVEWPKVRAKVLARFRKTDDGYRNDTHDEIQAESSRRAERQKRYRQKDRNVTPSPSPSPSPSPEERSTAARSESESLQSDEREAYARTAWEAWLERRGRGGPEMSSAEWVLITGWMDRAVPLRVVLRGIADCGGKLSPSTSLRYAAPAVLEAIEHWRKSQCI